MVAIFRPAGLIDRVDGGDAPSGIALKGAQVLHVPESSTNRHTFASWLVQRGRTLKEVQEALGHQTITMTMRYSHLAPDHLRAAVAVLDGALPASRLSEFITISAQGSAQELVPAGEMSQKSS